MIISITRCIISSLMLKLSLISTANIDFDIFTTVPLFNTNSNNENILFFEIKVAGFTIYWQARFHKLLINSNPFKNASSSKDPTFAHFAYPYTWATCMLCLLSKTRMPSVKFFGMYKLRCGYHLDQSAVRNCQFSICNNDVN